MYTACFNRAEFPRKLKITLSWLLSKVRNKLPFKSKKPPTQTHHLLRLRDLLQAHSRLPQALVNTLVICQSNRTHSKSLSKMRASLPIRQFSWLRRE